MTAYNILFSILVVLSLIESVTTWITLKKKEARELNPIFRAVISKLGLTGAMAVKLLCSALAFWGIWSYQSIWVLTVGIPLLAVVVNNIIVMKKAKK